MKNNLEIGDEEMARPRKYDSPEQARNEQLKKIRMYNEGGNKTNEKTGEEITYKAHYDRLTLRMKAGSRDLLIEHMEQKIRQLEELEQMADRTPEQENNLHELRTLYKISTRGTPSVNSLILNLLHKETGINF